MEMEELSLVDAPILEALDADIDIWDPRLGADNEILTPMED